MPRFSVSVKELREIDTEFEVEAVDKDAAKKMGEHYEQHINRGKMGVLGEDMVTNHSREVTSVEEIKDQ
jgi:hypothetical protein